MNMCLKCSLSFVACWILSDTAKEELGFFLNRTQMFTLSQYITSEIGDVSDEI